LSEREPVVVVVSAPSGAGKSTVISRVLAELGGIRFSVSHTTRAPRGDDKEGIDYHFVDRASFERLRDESKLLEWAEVHGNLYGTALTELMRAREEGVDLLLDLDVHGAAQVRQKLPDAVTVFVLPPSYPELERRLRGRGEDDEATIEKRLGAAGREIGAFWHYDYAIVNDDLDACVRELKSIIRAARCAVPVMAQRAREIEKTFQIRETKEETKTA
jgi:guanylate kinase